MLPKKNRLDRKTLDRVFKDGRNIHTPLFNFKYILNSEPEKRISVVAPKSIAKLAVKRNKIRRLGYRILKKYINSFPKGITATLTFKKDTNQIEILENEIQPIIQKISRTAN